MKIVDEILHSAFCYNGQEKLVLKLIFFLIKIHKYVDAHNLATDSLQALKNATLFVHNYTELPTQNFYYTYVLMIVRKRVPNTNSYFL